MEATTRNPTVPGAEGEEEHPPVRFGLQDGGCLGAAQFPTGPCGADAGGSQGIEGFQKPGGTPVHHMVVGQDTGVDSSSYQHPRVPGVHSIVDPLGSVILAQRDAGLEVDDPKGGSHLLQHLEGIPPGDILLGKTASNPHPIPLPAQTRR
jgi:hypothetical protein